MKSLILRAVKKDESYINTLNNMFLEIIYALKEYKLININFNLGNVHKISSFIYYIFCYFGSKTSTIGQEYLNIKKDNISIINVLFNIFKNEFLYFLYKNIYFIGICLSKYFYLINFEYEDFCKGLSDFELCVLFLTGKYYSLLDVFFKSEYFNLNKESNLESETQSKSSSQIFKSGAFKILSYAIIYTYLFKLKKNIDKFTESEKTKEKMMVNSKNIDKNVNFSVNVNEKHRILKTKSFKNTSNYEHDCLICLEQINIEKSDAALTICGHIFCWDCITNSIQENPKCPKCRKQIYLNDVIIM